MNYLIGIFFIAMGIAALASGNDSSDSLGSPEHKGILESMKDELAELEQQEKSLRQEVEVE